MGGITSTSSANALFRPTAGPDAVDDDAPITTAPPEAPDAPGGDSLGLTPTGQTSDEGLGSAELSVAQASGASADDFLKTLFDEAEAPASKEKAKGWTMAVDLTTTLHLQDGDAGAASKAKQLKDLAAKTEGKPVTIVAQQITQTPDGPHVERFNIANGKVTSLGSHPSEGFAEDLQSLVADASKNNPAEHMGLIIQSHGNAVDGMAGDNGGASVLALRDAIAKGLESGGVSKLDVLDLDACLMGQNEILSSMGPLADHVVASTEVELALSGPKGEKFDAQRTDTVLDALLQNPEMSGADLAKKTIEVADAGTPTLAAYDTSKLGALETSIDSFGSALSSAARDPKNRAAIENAVKSVPHFGDLGGADSESTNTGSQQRDLKTFAQAIDGAIASGQLKDPDGKLAKASADVQQAIGDAVEAKHDANSYMDYTKMGNVGVFLPSDKFFKGDARSNQTPMAMISDTAKTLSKRDDYIDFGRWASNAAASLSKEVPANMRHQYQQFQVAADAIAHAKTQAQAQAATRHMIAVAEHLEKGPLGKELRNEQTAKHDVWSGLQLSEAKMEGHNAGWNAFLDTMKATAK